MSAPSPLSADQTAATIRRRRVVVSGLGMLTPMGLGVSENAQGFRQGRTTQRPVTLFDTDRMRVHSACELELPNALPITKLTERESARMDRATEDGRAALLHGWLPKSSHS